MDLENLVNQSFESERDFPFDEGNWDELSRELDKGQRKKAWPLWWFWLSLLLLLLLLGNWYAQSQTISRLEAQVAELSMAAPVAIAHTDTLWRVDTLVKTVVQKVFLSGYENSTPALKTPLVSNLPTVPEKENIVSVPSITNAPERLNTSLSTLPALPKISELSYQRVPHICFVPIKSPVKVQDQTTHNQIGLSYRTGTVQDPANTTKTGVIQQQFQQAGIQWQRSLWKGLGFEVELGQEWQDYQAKDSLASFYGIDTPDFYFANGFTTHQQSIYYRLGLNWQFARRSPISPVLGIGVLGQSSILADVQATFATDSPYFDPEQNKQSTYRKDALSLNYWYAMLGVNWQFAPRWSVRLSGTYYKPRNGLLEYQKQHSLGAQIYYYF